MKLAIYGRVLQEVHIEFVQFLLDFLYENKHEVQVERDYFEHIKPLLRFDADWLQCCLTHTDLAPDTRAVLSLGGDGTLLNSIRLVKDSGVPILGINMGRLGFLTSIAKTEMEQAMHDLEQGKFSLDSRSLLTFNAKNPIFGSFNFALNEFTIHKLDTSSLITIHAYLNGAFLNSYWADGLIISTPTGSTGYSLSCGGPIIAPQTQNLVLTPVAPHNLNVRPIIVPDSAELSFEVEGRSEEFSCTLDSRYRLFDAKEHITIRKASFKVNLVRFEAYSFLSTLRDKLMWGVDSRSSEIR